MAKWKNGKMARWQDGKMAKWRNGEMKKSQILVWQNVKAMHTPPCHVEQTKPLSWLPQWITIATLILFSCSARYPCAQLLECAQPPAKARGSESETSEKRRGFQVAS